MGRKVVVIEVVLPVRRAYVTRFAGAAPAGGRALVRSCPRLPVLVRGGLRLSAVRGAPAAPPRPARRYPSPLAPHRPGAAASRPVRTRWAAGSRVGRGPLVEDPYRLGGDR